MKIRLVIGKSASEAEILGQAAELQKYFRCAAMGNDGEALISVDVAGDSSLEEQPTAEGVLAIIREVSEMLAKTESFDQEVSVLPVEDIWAGTEGFSAFWTPAGEDEVRANITAIVRPGITELCACGDPEKLLEMEKDPEWVPHHDPKTMKLRYSNYGASRMVQFSLSDVTTWIRKGRISRDDFQSFPRIYSLRAE
jgi:hypothetical protein